MKWLTFLFFIIFSVNIVYSQPYKILHNFSGSENDGSHPLTALILKDNILFGTTGLGGLKNKGTIFKIDKNGTNFYILHSFKNDDTDCLTPSGNFVQIDSFLYVPLYNGGPTNGGGICKVKIDGTYYEIIHFFNAEDTNGYNPSGLIKYGQYLYGVTEHGGKSNAGTIYRIYTDGTNYEILHYFTQKDANDGVGPLGLVQYDSVLYGMTFHGGSIFDLSTSRGIAYRINIDGTGFRLIFDFSKCTFGGNPYGTLEVGDSVLFGTIPFGGNKGKGMLFRMNLDGSDAKMIHSFDGGFLDGFLPCISITCYDSILYGTTAQGGLCDSGTVFRINKDGSGFRLLHSFGNPKEGYYGGRGLMIQDSIIYGITQGGIYDKGIIFSLDLREYYKQCGDGLFDFPKFINNSQVTLNSDANIHDSTVRLSKSESYSTGSIFFNEPQIISSGFRTSFSFRFSDGYNDYNDGSPAGADGMAFILQSNNPMAIGGTGFDIGYAGIPNSLAIEFDTYRNDDDPAYDCGDPDGSHVAVFSKGNLPNSSDHRTSALLGSTSNIPLLKADSTIYYAKIEYNYDNNKLIIWLDTTGQFKNIALEVDSINVSALLKLIEGKKAFVGFTSATGKSFQNTDLLSWSFCPFIDKGITDVVEQSEARNTDYFWASPAYPMPASSIAKSRIYWDSDFDMDGSVMGVYNILGNQISTKDKININKLQSYMGILEWDCREVPSGVYFIVINHNSKTDVIPVIVER
jgi:uncharacterized repeat protein (TIGR03803 family)